MFEVLNISQGKPTHVQSWINKHGEDDFSPKHVHSNSFISGGVYLQCEPNSGKICFVNPIIQHGQQIQFDQTLVMLISLMLTVGLLKHIEEIYLFFHLI